MPFKTKLKLLSPWNGKTRFSLREILTSPPKPAGLIHTESATKTNEFSPSKIANFIPITIFATAELGLKIKSVRPTKNLFPFMLSSILKGNPVLFIPNRAVNDLVVLRYDKYESNFVLGKLPTTLST